MLNALKRKKSQSKDSKESVKQVPALSNIQKVTMRRNTDEVIFNHQCEKEVIDDPSYNEESEHKVTIEMVDQINYEEYIPLDEREVPVEKRDDCKTIDCSTLFSPIKNMARVTMNPNGTLYVGYYVDEKGNRFIAYVQQYKDGSFSPKMMIPQACIMMAQNYSTLQAKDISGGFKKAIAKDYVNAYQEYYNKFTGDNNVDMLDVKDILNALYTVQGKIPVCSNMYEEMTDEDFYWNVINKMNLYCCQVYTRAHKSYYSLEDCEIKALADSLGMKKIELLNKLRQAGFLYLTKSSRGFQTNVRLDDTFTEWMYCIYKLPYFIGDKEQDSAELLKLL